MTKCRTLWAIWRKNMPVKFSQNFVAQLKIIVDFIAQDSLQSAQNFERNLTNKLNGLNFMPYKCRKSIHFDDENVRDFIFKGYVVPYLIDTKNDCIVILAICKENLLK